MKEKVHPAVRQALGGVRRRLRLYHGVQGGTMGLLAAGISCAILAAVSYFVPIPGLLLIMAAAAAGLFVLAVLAGLVWPVPLELAARRADAAGLNERAITALVLQGDTPMTLLQREDAIRHITALPPKAAVPLKPPKRPLLAAGAIALLTCAALAAIPNPQNVVLARREAFQKAMAAQAETVEKAAEELEDSFLTKEEVAALRKLMGDMARELRNAREPQQAYLAMDKAQRSLQDLQKNASDRARQTAAQAFAQSGLKALSDAMARSDAKAASEAVGQLKDSDAKDTSAALAQAASLLPEGALQSAAAQAAQAMNAGDAQSLNAALNALNAAVQSACAGQSAGAAGNLSALLAQLRAGTLAASQGSSGQGAGAGQGQGNGTGQGTGSGQGTGQGAGGGAGKGSTNQDAGIGKGNTGSMGEGSSPPEYKLGQYEKIYDPTRLNGADDRYSASGQMGEGESQQLQLGPGLGDASGQVPYNEVIFSYQEAAARAAQQESLPEGLRLWVDGYFQALIE